MQGPTAGFLPDGRRLHLQHGPIDLIIDAVGRDRARALRQAEARFQTILTGLVAELALLRAPLGDPLPQGPVARRMVRAVARHGGVFITPMAAVAGAVGDEICAAMVAGCDLERAFVNNGGDIAVWLGAGQHWVAAIHTGANDKGRVLMTANAPARGLATSGWRGRSHSLGIADAVSVLARDAASADAAATLIANAVNLPDHPAIMRRPACDLAPDSDLGKRLVTVAVGRLMGPEVERALGRGADLGRRMLARGLIDGAALFLQGETRLVGAFPAREIYQNEGENARIQIA